jgi:Flp pilus assembly protein TadG
MRIPRHQRLPRSGASLVEFAIVGPVALLLLIGLVVAALGVYRYQQVAALAREGSRYASVHGGMYAKETGNPAATQQDIYNNAILPYAAGLDSNALSCNVTWNTDNYPYHTVVVNGQVTPVTNTVSVTVTYQWMPEAFFGGVTLTSTSVVPITY